MLIKESRLRELVRQLLREGGGGESVDLELSDEEVKSALDDLDLTDDVELTQVLEEFPNFEDFHDRHVRKKNLEMSTKYLLKMKVKSPEKFKEVVKKWVKEQGGPSQSTSFGLETKRWMKALESEELLKRFRTMFGKGNFDAENGKLGDLTYQFLQNHAWVSFASWYLAMAIKPREISTNPYKRGGWTDPTNRKVDRSK